MSHHNEMEVRFLSLPENEAFARVVIAAFAAQLSPTVSEIADIKTAVSEAVTNAIVHGYEGTRGTVILRASIDGTLLTIEITDKGRGIADIPQAMELVPGGAAISIGSIFGDMFKEKKKKLESK